MQNFFQLRIKKKEGWLAGHFAQSRYCELGNTDEYRRVRTFTDYGNMVQCMPCAVKFQKHMAAREPKPCPYSSVSVRISPYYSARTMCFAQYALPSRRSFQKEKRFFVEKNAGKCYIMLQKKRLYHEKDHLF